MWWCPASIIIYYLLNQDGRPKCGLLSNILSNIKLKLILFFIKGREGGVWITSLPKLILYNIFIYCKS